MSGGIWIRRQRLRGTVPWSGETKLEVLGHNDQQCVWHTKGQTYNQMNTIKVKHGGQVVFLTAGNSNLNHVPGIMDLQKYQTILKRSVISSVNK